MNYRLQKNLIKYLNDYRELLDSNEYKVIGSIDIIIDHINENNHSINKITKKKDIYDLLELFDAKRFDELKLNNIDLNFEQIDERDDLILQLEKEKLEKYTINELKIIYYILTEDKNDFIMKSKKKDILVKHVKDMIIDFRRSSKLIRD